jgi:hypothetical protein
VETTTTSTPFRTKLWTEVEPIIIHGVIVLVALGFLILIGLLIQVMNVSFPDHRNIMINLETGDIFLTIALLSLYGLYTFVLVSRRLYRNIRSEFGVPAIGAIRE